MLLSRRAWWFGFVRRSTVRATLVAGLLAGCSVEVAGDAGELGEPAPELGKADSSATRARWVRRQIELWNRELAAADRERKYQRMAESPSNFFRATNHLYWAQYGHDARLRRYGDSSETATLLVGDVHYRNFGAIEDDHGELAYDLNDFDNALIADYQLDVWRMAISLVLLGYERNDSTAQIHELVDAFVEAYLDAMDDARDSELPIFDIESTNGAVSDLLEALERDDYRRALLDEWTVRRGSNGRVFDSSNEELAVVSAAQEQEIRGAMSAYRATLTGGSSLGSSHFAVKSVTERLNAGLGSLGLERYYVLIEGESSSASDDRILDIKRQPRSTGAVFFDREERSWNDSRWSNDGERVIASQRAMLRRADDHLGAMRLGGEWYSVRLRNFDSVKAEDVSRSELLDLASDWGGIVANAHVRGDESDSRTPLSDDLPHALHDRTDGEHREFRDLTWEIALEGASLVYRDYTAFLPLVGR